MTDYYHHVRREIEPLLPKVAHRVLEVGAGSGLTLKWLKSVYPKSQTTGVELNASLSDQLQANADVAVIGDVDECLNALKTYDLILFLDVLEHLIDPVNALQNIIGRLEKTGRVIVSVPNIAHLSVSIPLLFRRRFAYQDAGIMDRTHVKFFVEDTAVKLMNAAGLTVTKGLMSGLHGSKSKTIDRLTFGRLRHHLSKQYIMLGELSVGPVCQGMVSWAIAE